MKYSEWQNDKILSEAPYELVQQIIDMITQRVDDIVDRYVSRKIGELGNQTDAPASSRQQAQDATRSAFAEPKQGLIKQAASWLANKMKRKPATPIMPTGPQFVSAPYYPTNSYVAARMREQVEEMIGQLVEVDDPEVKAEIEKLAQDIVGLAQGDAAQANPSDEEIEARRQAAAMPKKRRAYRSNRGNAKPSEPEIDLPPEATPKKKRQEKVEKPRDPWDVLKSPKNNKDIEKAINSLLDERISPKQLYLAIKDNKLAIAIMRQALHDRGMYGDVDKLNRGFSFWNRFNPF